MSVTEAPKTPWHLWVVGGLALVWGAVGANDYLMTQTRNEAYMSQFTPEQLDYFYGFPFWVDATWALGVWGAVLGSLLLLLRTRWAVPLLWLSLAGIVVTALHNYVLADVSLSEVVGPFALAFSAVIFVVAVFLIWYAQRMHTRGILR